MTKSKKAVILIVEGITDEIVLEPLRQYVHQNQLFIKVIHGDPYTKKWHQSKTAKEIVGEIMKEVKIETKFKNSDILQVVQLIDTDGIFIPIDHFVVDTTIQPEDEKSYLYSQNSNEVKVISEPAKDALIRTWQKKKNLVMSLRGGIHYSNNKIPFTLFYNSLNLDHVITGEQLPKKEKERAALRLLAMVESKEIDFRDFFKEKLISPTYSESWEGLIKNLGWQQAQSNLFFLIENLNSFEQDPK